MILHFGMFSSLSRVYVKDVKRCYVLLTCSGIFLRPCVSVHVETLNPEHGDRVHVETQENRLGFYSCILLSRVFTSTSLVE